MNLSKANAPTEDTVKIETEPLVTDWQLSRLEVDIRQDDLRTFKFEDVIGTVDSETPQKSNDNFIAPKISKGAMLKQIQKEAGTLRKKK